MNWFLPFSMVAGMAIAAIAVPEHERLTLRFIVAIIVLSTLSTVGAWIMIWLERRGR